MTVFYPYTATRDDGIELKYSIRSMVKYFKDLTHVVVIGDKPSWLTQACHIYCPDIPKRKEYSVYRKLMFFKDFKPVLLCHDDIFALQPFDRNLPNYYRGTCHEAISRTVERRFKDMFAACLPNWLNFEIHCPMVIDPSKIENEDMDFLLKTTYANRLKLPGVDIVDCKIRQNLVRGEIYQEIKDRPFFSTHDNATGDILKVLNELYPDKSEYEV